MASTSESEATSAAKVDLGKCDATFAPESYVSTQHLPKREYHGGNRPAEGGGEDPMAKYRKWGYETWPPEHEGVPLAAQADVDSPWYRGRQWAVWLAVEPSTWFHSKLVKFRESQPGWKRPIYYHRKYARVPDIDMCEEGDGVCVYEADVQYQRDMRVEAVIVNRLRDRVEHCWQYEKQDWARKCKKVFDDFLDSHTNYIIKYGEMGALHTVTNALMKQKHRMIWERRTPHMIYTLYGKKYTENRFYGPDVIQYDDQYSHPK